MGRRGPKPKPTRLKKLAGNPGKRKLNRREPLPAAGTPGCPAWLTEAAREEWRRVVPELEQLGLLTHLDQQPLACYCQAVADAGDARAQIEAEGTTFTTEKGYVGKHPAVTRFAEACARIKQFAAEFGFTPSSRSRITLPEPPAAPDPLDAMLLGVAATEKTTEKQRGK